MSLAAKPASSLCRPCAVTNGQRGVVRIPHYSTPLNMMSVHIFFYVKERKGEDGGKLRLSLRYPACWNLCVSTRIAQSKALESKAVGASGGSPVSAVLT
jgi:hypothetical protein